MARGPLCTTALAGILWSYLLGTACFAQEQQLAEAAPRDARTLYQLCDQGIQALHNGSTAQAVHDLGAVFEAMPAYTHATYGSVAYWLGRAQEATGQPERAVAVWTAGFQALQAVGRVDVALADAVARVVYRRQAETYFALAADAYLLALAHLDLSLPTAQQDLLDDHLEALTPILPDEIREATGLVDWKPGTPLSPQPDRGARLAAWWRSQDPLPATRQNEGLEEHLRRVAHARQHYRHPQTGRLDDRAVIYIRLGPPPQQATIAFDSIEFRRRVFNQIAALTPGSFPANELWGYPHLDKNAQYLFVQHTDGLYRLGETNDLIPPTLRMGLGFSQRGTVKAEALIWTLHEIYRQLALYAPAYAARYNETADYIERLDDNAFLAEMDRRSEALAQSRRSVDATQNQGGNAEAKDQARTLGLPRLPNVFATTMIDQAHSDDRIARVQRDRRVPRTASNLLGDVELLEMAVRWARFLDTDGTTRTEIYWSTSAQALAPASAEPANTRAGRLRAASPYLLAVAIVQKTAAYQERAVHYDGHLIDATWIAQAEDVLAPQTSTVRGDTGLFHLAMQWDQYQTRTDANGKPGRVDRHLKANTYRADTLTALRADDRFLEMSDLKPMMLLGETPTPSLIDPEDAAPYPFSGITRETPVGLYFELYHLTFGPDDQTHYTVDYTVTQHATGRRLRRRSGDGKSTSAQTSYTGTERTAREFILLDLNEWSGTGRLAITVRATDDPTGRQIERTVTFLLEK